MSITKVEECEYMNTGSLMIPKYNQTRLIQETLGIASRLNQDQENKDQEES